MKKQVLLFILAILPPIIFAQNYSVDLNILNTPNENGRVVTIAGEVTNVEYIVIDPDNELSNNDIIRLVKINTGE